MDASTWSAWTANAIAIVALAYTWSSSRGSRRNARLAQQQAAESLRAAQGATKAQQNMAESMAELLDRLNAHPATTTAHDAEAVAPDVLPGRRPVPDESWRVENVRQNLYRLTNAGTATAYDVRLGTEHTTGFRPPAGVADGDVWAPGETHEFTSGASWEDGIPLLIVQWRQRPAGELRRWQRVVPR